MLPDRVSNPGPLTYESGALLFKDLLAVLEMLTLPEVRQKLDEMVSWQYQRGLHRGQTVACS